MIARCKGRIAAKPARSNRRTRVHRRIVRCLALRILPRRPSLIYPLTLPVPARSSSGVRDRRSLRLAAHDTTPRRQIPTSLQLVRARGSASWSECRLSRNGSPVRLERFQHGGHGRDLCPMSNPAKSHRRTCLDETTQLKLLERITPISINQAYLRARPAVSVSTVHCAVLQYRPQLSWFDHPQKEVLGMVAVTRCARPRQ